MRTPFIFSTPCTGRTDSLCCPQTEDTKNVSNGDNTLNFETDTFPGCFSEIPEGFWFTGGVEFAEFEVDDTVLYFMQAFTFPNYNSPTGSIDITFENLYSYEWYNMKTPQTEKGLDSEIVERKIPPGRRCLDPLL